MLATRIIPTLLYKDSTLVKGIGFNSWRRVGSALQAIKIYGIRQVDELVFLDISATLNKKGPDFDLINEFTNDCFMPLAVGGGIKTIEDARKLLFIGADKIIINTAAVYDPDLITKIAEKFGSQCVTVSIDYKKNTDNAYEVYTHSGLKSSSIDPISHAIESTKRGAGEILLTSIEHDGTMQGFDIEFISEVCSVVSVPVIASGGAGNRQHFLDAIIKGKASAVAAASIFHFTEQTPLDIKLYLKEHGISVRL